MTAAHARKHDHVEDDDEAENVAWLYGPPRDITPAGRSSGWRPPRPALHGPAVVCVHGPYGDSAHYAPADGRWDHPRAWLAHVSGPFRLERVADWSAGATGEVIARWTPDAGAELRTVEPPPEVLVRTPHGSTLATSPHAVRGADGAERVQYVIAPTGWRALLREALAEAVERRRVGTLDALRALWGVG